MRDYVICTDSGCDVDRETLSSWGVVSTPLSFLFEDGAASMHDGDMPAYQFYAKMREGKKSTTSAVNVEEFKSEFKKILDTDRDICWMGRLYRYLGR